MDKNFFRRPFGFCLMIVCQVAGGPALGPIGLFSMLGVALARVASALARPYSATGQVLDVVLAVHVGLLLFAAVLHGRR